MGVIWWKQRAYPLTEMTMVQPLNVKYSIDMSILVMGVRKVIREFGVDAVGISLIFLRGATVAGVTARWATTFQSGEPPFRSGGCFRGWRGVAHFLTRGAHL